ncbi:MAG: hypothetical protein HXS44_03130 [Theionarchaea archaeon]|nr:hypothetical protein [Theionarchaea archaeon]
MSEITFLRENLKGIKSVFLVKKGEPFDIDTNLDTEIRSLLKSISFVTEALDGRGKPVKKIIITGENHLFIFLKGPYMVGVVSSLEVSIPMLNMMVRKVLEHLEVPS